MNRFFISFFVVIATIGLSSCKTDKASKWPTLDLLQYDFPIAVKAPEGTTVKKSDLGVMQDLTLKGDGNFSVQILKSDVTNSDPKVVKDDQLSFVKSDPYFSKIIEEHEDGFIFEKKIDDRINYDFRYVKLQGDKEYIYQTGMLGTYTEEDVRSMYNAVH